MKVLLFLIFLISSTLNANENNFLAIDKEEKAYNFGVYTNLLGPELGISIEPSFFLFNFINLYFRYGGTIGEAGGGSESFTLRRAYTVGLNYFYNFNKNNSIFIGPGFLKTKDEANDSYYIAYLSMIYEYALNTGFAFKLGITSFVRNIYGRHEIKHLVPSFSIGYKF